jgi:hypothetical protein
MFRDDVFSKLVFAMADIAMPDNTFNVRSPSKYG